MNIEQLDILDDFLDRLCHNHVFDDIDAERFDNMLGQSVRIINDECEELIRRLILEFGDYTDEPRP